jgi:uncharacterized membrane protein
MGCSSNLDRLMTLRSSDVAVCCSNDSVSSRVRCCLLAYIAGSLGTLIGADLTNLDKVRGLGAPVASIGGAGTFDGIFLTGILAVLLASLYARPRAAHAG